MAKEYEMKIPAHKSIYSPNRKERELEVFFSEPERGINEDTGIVLLIAGFGGHATSNVYKKMRRECADKYNLVALQCNYFGYEFMQQPDRAFFDKAQLETVFTKNEIDRIYMHGAMDMNTLISIGRGYDHNISIMGFADCSEENPENFNDLGFMQAIDNISAVLSVMDVIYSNHYSFNTKKIILYGHSHGAYLAYLCNALAPTLFSLIIDNSAWLFPRYFNEIRITQKDVDNVLVEVQHSFLAAKMEYDSELLDLKSLYSTFNNICKIIAFQGVTDIVINAADKKSFCEGVNNCLYFEVTGGMVDNLVFGSTDHGLDADFLKLFDLAFEKFNISFGNNTLFDLPEEVSIKTAMRSYTIRYDNVLPQIVISQEQV